MGCCISRPDGPNSPYPGGAHESSRAINDPFGGVPAAGLGVSARGGGNDLGRGGDERRGMGQARGPNPNTAGDGTGDSTTPFSSSASSPSTVGNASQQAAAAAAPPIPSNVSRLPPPQSALAAHINKPIRRRQWASRSRVWTRQSIDQERTDFFDTRVTGRAEIWQTLHTALQILWEADLVEAARQADSGGQHEGPTASSSAEVAEAHATAQTILDAADITLPTGDMAQGAYDAFGNLYTMPPWIVSDPTNLDAGVRHDLDDETKRALFVEGEAALSSASEGGDESGDETDGQSGSNESDDNNDNDADDDDNDSTGLTQAQRQQRSNRIRSRREKKGKAVLLAGMDQMTVRARLSTLSKDVMIRIGREDTVHSLAHRITEAAKLPAKTRIRIAYMGKILKEGASLPAQGWKEGHIVSALVFDT